LADEARVYTWETIVEIDGSEQTGAGMAMLAQMRET
jgi:hypothetical protein